MRHLLLALVLGAAGTAAAQGMLAGCPLFPADHVLNMRIDALPVHPRSAAWVANVARNGDGATRNFHMDFGSGLYQGRPIGIPFNVVDAKQPRVPVTFRWPAESDGGPYPIPPDALIEGGGDRHLLVLDRTHCMLYELAAATTTDDGASWRAEAGAKFDLRSYALRPPDWTSTDAAGLAILPALALYDEVATGAIRHALRFSAQRTQRAYLWPARHHASNVTNPDVAPMGARFRMKAGVDITRFTGEARVIAQAMKTYGIVLADNGAPWMVTGAPDERWNNDTLKQLKALTGDDFEAVDTSALMIDPATARAVPQPPPPPRR